MPNEFYGRLVTGAAPTNDPHPAPQGPLYKMDARHLTVGALDTDFDFVTVSQFREGDLRQRFLFRKDDNSDRWMILPATQNTTVLGPDPAHATDEGARLCYAKPSAFAGNDDLYWWYFTQEQVSGDWIVQCSGANVTGTDRLGAMVLSPDRVSVILSDFPGSNHKTVWRIFEYESINNTFVAPIGASLF